MATVSDKSARKGFIFLTDGTMRVAFPHPDTGSLLS
jgi:hypothetical protein